MGSASKIQITRFDGLFQGGSAADESGEKVHEIALSALFSFQNHPFQVRGDEDMQKTVESIAQYGVLVPGIARPRAVSGYELIAGHRRKRASELAGKTTMPTLIRELDDDEATIIMVYSNKKFSVSTAADYIAPLKAAEQQWLLDKMTLISCSPTVAQLARIKKYSHDGALNETLVGEVLGEKRPVSVTLTLKKDTLTQYFPPDYTTQQMEEII